MLFKKKRNQLIGEFLIFAAWCDWLIGIAPCPTRWPYSEYRKDTVEKLLERVKFTEEPPLAP